MKQQAIKKSINVSEKLRKQVEKQKQINAENKRFIDDFKRICGGGK